MRPGAAPRTGPADRSGCGTADAGGARVSSHACPSSHDPRPEAIDPDVDLRVPAGRIEVAGPRTRKVVAVVAAGGAIGASARYGISLLWPSVWATFAATCWVACSSEC